MRPFQVMRLRNNAGAGLTFATLNPADKSANITLSGGNLTATRAAGAGAWASVRANQSKNAGKWCFEVKRNVDSATNGAHMPGFMLGASSINNFPGSDTGGGAATDSGVQLTTPNVTRWRNAVGTAAAGYGSVTLGQFLIIVVDVTAGNAWVKGSAQAGYVLGGDPVLGTTPSFTFPPGATIFPTIGLFDNPAEAVANFGASPFTNAIPSGFNPGWYT